MWKAVVNFMKQHENELLSCVMLFFAMLVIPLSFWVKKVEPKEEDLKTSKVMVKEQENEDKVAEKEGAEEKDNTTAEVEEKAEVEAQDKEEKKWKEPKEKNENKEDASSTASEEQSNKNTNKDNDSSSNQSKVVQRANPETGISWDGKSKIIYTCKDGSTGTTPEDGATYEVAPGLINTYEAPEVEEEQLSDGTCSQCGKTEGDGKNGTCLQFWAHDDNCPNCGEYVSVNTCHTCGK